MVLFMYWIHAEYEIYNLAATGHGAIRKQPGSVSHCLLFVLPVERVWSLLYHHQRNIKNKGSYTCCNVNLSHA